MISVICPVYNEEKYISKCIESLLLQDYPLDDIEIIFVDGGSRDNTRNIINKYAEKYDFINVINNNDRIVPVAMNMGIKYAKGAIIVRMDAHAAYAKNYISALVEKLFELNADNVGCVCKTDVINKNPKTLAIKEILSNKIGVGNSLFRLGIDKISEVDTVPFGCWQKNIFDKYGYFDSRLIRNQDIEMNKRIKRGGGKIYIIPDTYCTYFARETFVQIAKNNFNNGKWNILTVYFTKQFDSLSVRHFIPMVFILSIILPVVFGFFVFELLFLSFFSILSYFILISSISVVLSIKKKLNVLYLLIGFITLHFSYGIGSLTGVLKACALALYPFNKKMNKI
ncbi:MAG: glycosyltransferase family 2 protein [Treponema sp.]|nr:glycosyltransferase family 2 protein [Treponema sp.]